MTGEQTTSTTDAEMERLIAERVCGLRLWDNSDNTCWTDAPPEYTGLLKSKYIAIRNCDWHPLSDGSSMLRVIETMRAKGWSLRITIDYDDKGNHEVEFWKLAPAKMGLAYFTESNGLPRAVGLAAQRAEGVIP